MRKKGANAQLQREQAIKDPLKNKWKEFIKEIDQTLIVSVLMALLKVVPIAILPRTSVYNILDIGLAL